MADDLNLESILESSSGIAGGPYTSEAQAILSSALDGAAVRLTTSGTDALELSALVAGVGPGDVVAVPSFGFVTTALAFVRAGATVRYIDIDPTTLAMDPVDLAAKIDEQVKVVVPIHYAGVPARIDEIVAVAHEWGASVVEDNAHGLFGAFQGRPLGTFGATACLSFHGTKNISCGEGGAVIVNDFDLLDPVEVALEKGTDRQRFLRGEVDKYTWRDLGSSFGLGDYLAAILVDQLKRADQIQGARRAATELYLDLLSGPAEELGYELINWDSDSQSAYHLFYIVLEDASIRGELLRRLNEQGVKAMFHYPPLHLSPAGQKWGEPATCPVSERISESIVRLPLDQAITPKDVERISEVVVSTLTSMAAGQNHQQRASRPS